MAQEQLLLRNQLCYRLYTASRLITQAYEPYFKPLGITYTQYLVLLVLWEEDRQPLNDIGKKLLLGISTMSPLIKRMEKAELVARCDNEQDKRQQIIYLTPKGKAMEKEAAKVMSCLLQSLQDNELELNTLLTIVPVLDQIIDKLGSKHDNTSAQTE